MKKLVLIISIISMSYTLSAQEIKGLTQEQVKAQTKEVEVNKAMIEKFNNAEWSSDNIDFAAIYSNYSFSEIKLIVEGYKEDKLELSEPDIKKYLSKVKQELENKTEVSKTLAFR